MRNRLLALAILPALALPFATQASAKGCIKGAIVGGVAGHVVGHTIAGAAAGCIVGRHNAKEKSRAEQIRQEQTAPDQRRL